MKYRYCLAAADPSSSSSSSLSPPSLSPSNHIINTDKDRLSRAIENPKFDFVSRCFFPLYGVNEDPFTGSAHCTLYPYWVSKFDHIEPDPDYYNSCDEEESDSHQKVAFQSSKRGGVATLRFENNEKAKDKRDRKALCYWGALQPQ